MVISGILLLITEAAIFYTANYFFGGTVLIVVAILSIGMGVASWCDCNNKMHLSADDLVKGYLDSPVIGELLNHIPYVRCRQKRINGKPSHHNTPTAIVVLTVYVTLFVVVSHFFSSTILISVAVLGALQVYMAWCGCALRRQSVIGGLQNEIMKDKPDYISIIKCLEQI